MSNKLTVEHVQNAYQALASGSRDLCEQYWADDMVWEVPGHNQLSGWKHGLDGFLGFMHGIVDTPLPRVNRRSP